ncbi:hypothetical protein TSAR_009998, partial [Trichomalopsis sarcophagae]
MTSILPTLGTRYLGECCCCYIHVQQPRKPPRDDVILSTLGTSYLGVAVMIFVFCDHKKPPKDDVILSFLSTRYLGERCRHDICVLRPQKTPSSKTGLISINIDG